MSAKASITLDDELVQFIDRQTHNRSQFINELLCQEQKRQFLLELETAYIDQAHDSEMQREIALWDG